MGILHAGRGCNPVLNVQRWYYLFDHHNRWQILADSIRYCQDHKGLEWNG